MDDCIFCKIIKGQIPSYSIWEDETHMAFLDIFPVVEGMTVVVPKKHMPSYIVNLENKDICNLMNAVKKVAKLLDTKLDNVLRTKIVFEGIDVDHLHAKLYPMYKDKLHEIETPHKAAPEELDKISKKIKT